MATITVATPRAKRPVFINTNSKVIGAASTKVLVATLRQAAGDSNLDAMKALEGSDRKGVLVAMKVGTIAARAANSLEKALIRASRVRLPKAARDAYALTGVLPEGIELVEVEGIDDEDDDDIDADNDGDLGTD